MKKVEVLISAMHQEDMSIMERTGICTDALLINQCDKEEIKEETKDGCLLRSISTTERGLSRSRNMALTNARGDYCLICDDDEVLSPDYAEKIQTAFSEYPDADIICFQVERKGKKYETSPFKVGYVKSLRIASWQIVLNRKSVQKFGIVFDTNFGSGTPRGAGEENIFLFDCLRAGMKIYYVPVCIGKVAQEKSAWFKGFDEGYFENRGTITRRLMGRWIGILYCAYFLIGKYPVYHHNLSFFKAFSCMKKGFSKKF